MYIDIVSKQVNLSDEAYEYLVKFRGTSESFSDVVRRWGEEARQRALVDALGTWDLTEAEADKILGDIYSTRRRARTRGTPP